MDIYKIGKFTETEGCIRGIYELSDNECEKKNNGGTITILVQFIEFVEIIKLKYVPDEGGGQNSDTPRNNRRRRKGSGLEAKVLDKRMLLDDGELHTILPLKKSSRFVLIFSDLISLCDHNLRQIWSSSNQLDEVHLTPPDINDGKTRTKNNSSEEIRYRTSIKDPILMKNDRLVLLIVKKKKLMIHDLLEKKSRLSSFKCDDDVDENEAQQQILQIRNFESSRITMKLSRIIVMFSNGDLGMYIVGLSEGIYLNLICIRKIKTSARQYFTISSSGSGIHDRVVGVSRNKVRFWGLDRQNDDVFVHNLPMYNVIGSKVSGNYMLAVVKFDTRSERTNEEVRKLERIRKSDEGEIHTRRFYHYVLFDFFEDGREGRKRGNTRKKTVSVTTRTIGRVSGTVKSSRGYPILFFKSKSRQEEEEEEEEEEGEVGGINTQKFVIFLSPEEILGTRNVRGRRYYNPNEMRRYLCSLYDLEGKRMWLCEKLISTSRSNDSPAMIFLRNGILLIGNHAFRIS